MKRRAFFSILRGTPLLGAAVVTAQAQAEGPQLRLLPYNCECGSTLIYQKTPDGTPLMRCSGWSGCKWEKVWLTIPTVQGIPAGRQQAVAADREVEASEQERRKRAAVEEARRQDFDRKWNDIRAGARTPSFSRA